MICDIININIPGHSMITDLTDCLIWEFDMSSFYVLGKKYVFK